MNSNEPHIDTGTSHSVAPNISRANVVSADAGLAGGGQMGALMRSMDWDKTALGPPASWPQSLRTSVSICLGTSFPMMIAWGPELYMLYNDGYLPALGTRKHPRALGQPLLECFAEISHLIGPMFRGVLASGEPVGAEDMMFPIERHGFAEETYFVFSYSPIRDEFGRVGGVLTTCTETTQRVVGARRMRTLRDLAEGAGRAETAEDALDQAARTFEPADIPFALLYLVDPKGERARLVATSGIEATHPASISECDLYADTTPWPLAAAARTHKPEVVTALEKRFGPLPGGPWPEAASQAMVLPITRPGQPHPYGFLVAGVSPRRTLDDAYRSYLELVADHVATAVTNARAREEERRRIAALAELDTAKTAFFSNVSHEFRTPLTLMLGPLAEVLGGANGALDVAMRTQLDTVNRNAHRLLKLVNTLLDFSRIEAGRAHALFEPVDLAELTRDLSGMFRSTIERAGMRLAVDCPPMPEPTHVDRDMWEKIVLNLLSNAVKFTVEGEIGVSLRRKGAEVELEVRDTGVGIPALELPNVFKRFHRVTGTRSRSHEGSGIGLALVHELAHLHGGTVSVESELGHGTTFRVTVPAGQSARRAATANEAGTEHLPRLHNSDVKATPTRIAATAFVDEALRWLPDAATHVLRAPPIRADCPAGAANAVREPDSARVHRRTAARILVVDDNADMRAYLARLLASRWVVETAADGAAALEMARRSPPDLVLTDVMMPGLDGMGLLAALKSDERTRGTAVIVLSARAGEEARVDGLNAGADDYVVKPFSAPELVARVSALLAVVADRRAIETHRAALYDLFMQAPAPICVIRGPELVLEMANPLYMRLVDGREVVGKPLCDALPELDGPGLENLLRDVIESGRSQICRETLVRYSRHDGDVENGYFTFVYAPLRDASGRVDRVMVFCFEVTEQVLARKEVENARRQSEEASRAKDDFLAMLGHELRNPLAPIGTALELMKLRGCERVTERTIIERQVNHLVTLVDDLLDVARVVRGKVQLRRNPVDMANVIAKAIEMASPLLEERRHHLTTDVLPGLVVDGDEFRLTQVVSNLLTNAAKYTEPGGRITVVAAEDGAGVEVRVRDNGIGISAALAPQVFDLFVQGRRPTGGHGGLGLGLSLVRRFVELHGGVVSVHSEGPGLGSEFIVHLPRSTQEDDAPRVRRRARPQEQRASRVHRVLVVDDNRDAADTLAEMLGEMGYEARFVCDGLSALELAGSFDPELALIDIGMPLMDGHELARRLRKLPGGERVRLIAVTGYGQERDRALSRQSGFDLHLVKPLDFEVLAKNLEELTPDP